MLIRCAVTRAVETVSAHQQTPLTNRNRKPGNYTSVKPTAPTQHTQRRAADAQKSVSNVVRVERRETRTRRRTHGVTRKRRINRPILDGQLIHRSVETFPDFRIIDDVQITAGLIKSADLILRTTLLIISIRDAQSNKCVCCRLAVPVHHLV